MSLCIHGGEGSGVEGCLSQHTLREVDNPQGSDFKLLQQNNLIHTRGRGKCSTVSRGEMEEKRTKLTL